MAERVRDQVEQHALDLIGRAAARRPSPPRLEPHAARARLRLERRAGSSSTSSRELRLPQLERQRAGVDARELEEVVDERARASAPAAAAPAGTRPARRARPRAPRASPASTRSASEGRGSPRRRARGGRRRAAAGRAAISLNAARELGELARARPRSRARARSPARERRRTRRADGRSSVRDRPRDEQAAATATVEDAAARRGS